jgi:3-deoxy-D-arabino-heptulosonate 7-phosphate (DAHP) synthase
MSPLAANTETAMARSKLEPNLGTDAGDKLTVILRGGNSSPEFLQAALTRAGDSLSEASGSPTRRNDGKLAEISASTSIL